MRIDGKISGAVFRHSEVETGISYVESEEVIEVRLRSHQSSNSTNVYVLSRSCAIHLIDQLTEALNFSTK